MLQKRTNAALVDLQPTQLWNYCRADPVNKLDVPAVNLERPGDAKHFLLSKLKDLAKWA